MAEKTPLAQEPAERRKPKRPVLLAEVWEGVRPYVRDLLIEAILFGLFVLVLEAVTRMMHRTSLTELQQAFLEALHFYSMFFALVIFGASFMIQVALRRYEEVFERRNERR